MGRFFEYSVSGDEDFFYEELNSALGHISRENVEQEFRPLTAKQLRTLGRLDILGACRCNLSTEIADAEEICDGPLQLKASLVCIINAHKELEVNRAESIGGMDLEVDGNVFFDSVTVDAALEELRDTLPPCLDGSLIDIEEVAAVCGITLRQELDGEVSEERSRELIEQGFTRQQLETDGKEPDPVFWGRELARLDNRKRRMHGISGTWFELLVFATSAQSFVCYCTAENRLGDEFRQSRVCRSREEVLSCVRECDLLPEFEAGEQDWLSQLEDHAAP